MVLGRDSLCRCLVMGIWGVVLGLLGIVTPSLWDFILGASLFVSGNCILLIKALAG